MPCSCTSRSPCSSSWRRCDARWKAPREWSTRPRDLDTHRRGQHSGHDIVMTQARTVGELRSSGYRSKSVKQEMRDNLVARLRRGESFLPGIVGYNDTVVPQIENAVLSGQDIVLLGERGQAKTRIARSLINLLDEETPAIVGCEINDDPFAPICKACQL